MPLQPVTLMLSRTDLSAPDAERQLTAALDEALADAGADPGSYRFRMLPTLGRYDSIALWSYRQAPERDWLNLLGSFPSFKKMDVQHGYAESGGLDAFWRVLQGDDYPVLLLSYLRTRDNVVLAHGSYAFRSLERRIRADLPPERSLVVRTVGWPDFAVLLLGDDMEEVLRQAQQVWGLGLGQLSEATASAQWLLSRAKENEPAFSRSFSLLAYDGNSPRPLQGELLRPSISLRFHTGSDGVIARRLKSNPPAGLTPQFSAQLGLDDGVISFTPEGPVAAQTLVPWYMRVLVPRLRSVVHASELRLNLPPGPFAVPSADPPRLPAVRFRRSFMAALQSDPTTVPLAGALQSLTRMVNWGMNHDALYRSLADLYLHAQAVSRSLPRDAVEAARPAGSPQYRAQLTTLTRLFSEAMAQRLQGSYYDMMSDSPEVVQELSGGMHDSLLYLWAIQDTVLGAIGELVGEPSTTAYWLVSKAGEPGSCSPLGTKAFVFRISSPLLFDLRQGLYAVGHEIGHAVFLLSQQALAGYPGTPPVWYEQLREAAADPGANPQFLFDLFGELFADAFATIAFLHGDVAEEQRRLAGLLRPYLEVQDEAFVLQAAVRLLFSVWMRRALPDPPRPPAATVGLFLNDTVPLTVPAMGAPALETLRFLIESCEGSRQQFEPATADFLASALDRMMEVGLLTPALFAAYDSVFQSAGAVVAAYHHSDSVSDTQRARAKDLQQWLRQLRSGTFLEAMQAREGLYHAAMMGLGRRLGG